MSLETWLQRLWYGPAWRSLPLWPVSWLFRGVVATRAWLYRVGVLRRLAVGVPVIVVGNLTVGGTGKTPVAGWLVQRLASSGRKVGVVLRGYGAGHRGEPRIVELSDSSSMVGDEALLHARRGAHVVVIGADRVAAARLAQARGADIVVSDDGLQHLRLARDYEIAVVDGGRGLGNRRMLPAGPLREPAARLERADAIVVTQRGEAGRPAVTPASVAPLHIAARFSLGEAVNLLSGERRPPGFFAGRRDLHAIAGIGHPQAFFGALRAHGLEFTPHALPDHVAPDPAALPFPRATTVLMTEKDAVKCAPFAQPTWWWVELDVTFDHADARRLLASIFERAGLTGAGVTSGG